MGGGCDHHCRVERVYVEWFYNAREDEADMHFEPCLLFTPSIYPVYDSVVEPCFVLFLSMFFIHMVTF